MQGFEKEILQSNLVTKCKVIEDEFILLIKRLDVTYEKIKKLSEEISSRSEIEISVNLKNKLTTKLTAIKSKIEKHKELANVKE